MTSQTNEQALEAAIEKCLTGTCLEEIRNSIGADSVAEQTGNYRGGKGYEVGNSKDFNARYAIDEIRFRHFLETTQPKELKKLQRHSDWKRKILERYDRMIKNAASCTC